MIKLTIGNNVDRKRDIFEEDITVSQAFQNNGINVSSGTAYHLNGMPLPRESGNMTIAEIGARDGDFLLAVQKADNAA